MNSAPRLLSRLRGIVALLPVVTAGSAWGQCEVRELLASDGVGFDRFGQSLAISGDVAIVGAWHHAHPNGFESGAAYVFQRDQGGQNNWGQVWELFPLSGLSEDRFATSVDISGDTVIAGAPLDDDNGTNSGSAYVFRYDGEASVWVEQPKLLTSDGLPSDEFGRSVAISGDVAIVGTPLHDHQGSASGAAYVYRFDGTTWMEEVELLASDGVGAGRFGSAVAISGNVAIVGADADDENGSDAGAAYTYRYDGSSWVEEDKLLASDGLPGDRFGANLAISGDLAIVGVPVGDGNQSNTGTAYIYRYNGSTWLEEIKLFASDGVNGDQFGRSVAVGGNVALIGAPSDYEVNDDERTGAVYVYRFDGTAWGHEIKFLASDTQVDDQFGNSVAISGDSAIVASFVHDDNGASSGSAYVFAGLTGTDCNGNATSDSCDIFEGLSADCNVNAVPDECDITTGFSQDCNENGVPDACDVISGTSEDCDGDEVPDVCQALYFVDASSPLGPIGDGFPQTYIIAAPPEPSPQPATTVLISLAAQADLAAMTEWVDVFLNSQLIATVFQQGASDCPGSPDVAQLTLDVQTFNAMVAGGDAQFDLVASFAVDPGFCADSFITIQVEYQAVTEDDCNGNTVPDICDIFFGEAIDKNGDLIPDECQLCSTDVNGDRVINVLDLIDLLLCFGAPVPGCESEDVNADGTVNVLDLIDLLLAFGTACP